MKHVIFSFTLVVLLAISSSCRKSRTEPDQITYTNEFGFIDGNQDNTDWLTNETWTNFEKKLFSDYSSYNFNCGTTFKITVYPNPNPNGVYNFQYENNEIIEIDLVLVDAEFNVLFDQKITNPGNVFALSINEYFTEQGQILRLYYVMKNTNGCYFKGHGDLKKE